MSGLVWHGVWINWSHGPIRGATLTLGEREGGLLIAFIAFFVTLVGAQLFKILNFTFHQIRSRVSPQDGLYHQQQVIFRNSSSAASAAWNFLQQTWAWNRRARLSMLRTLPWALFCIAYMAAFGLAAVFSSEITKSPGSARLVESSGCGYWATIPEINSAIAIKAYSGRVANLSLANAAYARECYGGNSTSLTCGKMPKPALLSTTNPNASCPFADGMCEWGATGAFEIKSKRIDSLYDLGINTRDSDRLEFQKVATCSPLIKQGFIQSMPGGPESGYGIVGDMLYTYMYGPSVLTGGKVNSTDHTYMYNNHTGLDGVGYRLWTDNHPAGTTLEESGWKPIAELNRTDADLSIMFLSQNSISYAEPVDDPMFSAHIAFDFGSLNLDFSYYTGNYYVNVMACTDQYQICNPHNQACTGLMGVHQVLPYITYNNDKLSLNNMQQAISIRMMRHAFETSFHSIIVAQAENGLLAKESLVDKLSQPLPPNQWHLEVENFFNKGLAQLQIATVEYATGPPIGPGAVLNQPWNDGSTLADDPTNVAAEAMCYSQMVNDSSDSVSFSVLGMVVLFAIGGLIIIVSLCIDTLVGWIQQRFGIGTHARMCWLLDDKLQLHRYLNQELGNGHWSQVYNSVPNTTSHDKFGTLATVSKRNGTSENIMHYPPGTPPKSAMEHGPPVYQGVGYPGRGYTQVRTNEDHWRAGVAP